MGRSLPWAKVQAQTEPSRKPKAQAQLPRLPQQAAASLNRNVGNEASHPKKQGRLKREGRTPSTSPPPAPPSVEFMHEGFDHDDIYIMVEDEFYSVAQSFTQHLHHAEYLRLKTLAKAKGSSNLGNTSRPTDSVTKMREELKKKKQAELQAEKHKQALTRLGGEAAKKRIKLSGKEDNDSELEEDDLWAGTTLKGLMSSPSMVKTSLVGLSGNKSGTRAAAGHSPPKVPGSKNNVTLDLSTSTKSEERIRGRDASSQATASDDDDDLDAPIHKPREVPALKSIEEDLSTLAASKVSTVAAKSYTSLQPHQRQVASPYGSKYKDTSLSLSPESESDDRQTLPKLPMHRMSRPLRQPIHAKIRSRGKEADAKSSSNVNEIPIFLV